jgi:putative ABC transport system substrate-binding protein
MRRREFISLFGGSAVAWPLTARAQQSGQMRRIAVLSPLTEDDPEEKARTIATFLPALQQLGWTEDSNIRIEYRWGAGNLHTIRKYAAELVASAPEVIVSTGSATVGPLLELTRTVPIALRDQRRSVLGSRQARAAVL